MIPSYYDLEVNENRYSKDDFDPEDNDAVIVNEIFDLTKINIDGLREVSKSI
jgi:hypothetical protein